MKPEPSRRDVLWLAGLAGVGSLAAACTGTTSASRTSAGPPTTADGSAASSGTSITGSPASGSASPTSAATAKPTYAELSQRLGSRLARPGQHRYQPSALLYNPRFKDKVKPAAIAYCADRNDVVDCVRFAAEGGASLRLRNGGHSYGGWSSGSGLVADLAAINAVRVDHAAMTATIGAGALLGDVYSKLDAQGVSIGAGSCATVGVTGLTLGGGVGLLTRRYGLTCDQLASAVVVTADAKVLKVSADEHPDLFWALRGGGGSFAAVTSLTLTVRTAPTVQEVFLQWSGSDAVEVVSAWQEWTRSAPRELWSTCKVLARPGEGVRAVVSAFWSGPGSPDKSIGKLLAATPSPSTNSPSSNPYGAAMLGAAGCSGSARACTAAALSPAQRQAEAAASSILQKPLSSAAVRALVDAVEAGLDVTGMVEGGVSFDALGGAVSDIGSRGTAFPWRAAIADVQYTATWPYDRATEHRGRYDAFVQGLRTTLLPSVGSSGYVNYADPSLRDYATAYWGPNLSRLTQIKKTYDPHNVFTFPQAVPV